MNRIAFAFLLLVLFSCDLGDSTPPLERVAYDHAYMALEEKLKEGGEVTGVNRGEEWITNNGDSLFVIKLKGTWEDGSHKRWPYFAQLHVKYPTDSTYQVEFKAFKAE